MTKSRGARIQRGRREGLGLVIGDPRDLGGAARRVEHHAGPGAELVRGRRSAGPRPRPRWSDQRMPGPIGRSSSSNPANVSRGGREPDHLDPVVLGPRPRRAAARTRRRPRATSPPGPAPPSRAGVGRRDLGPRDGDETIVAPERRLGRAGPEVEREDRHPAASVRTTLAMAEKSSRPNPAALVAPRIWRTIPDVNSGTPGLRGVVDREVEVLGHEVGHEPGRPAVRRRAVGDDALGREPGAHRDAVAGRVGEHLVAAAPRSTPGLWAITVASDDREHLCRVDEVVAELHDLAHPRAADVHDEPRERVERGPGGVERRLVAARPSG